MPKPKSVLFAGNGLSLGGFALAFGTILLVLYGDVALGFRTFYYRDFGMFGYPLAYHHRLSFWDGEVPLWNPYSGLGMPFLAQWNTLVLYPGSLIYLLMPLPWGVNLFVVIHMFWAGVGMYWLAWKWAGDRLGACVAAMAYGLGGLLINSLMWPNNIAAFGWMPWVVLAVETACRRGGPWMLHAAILGTMQMLTGAPEIILLTWVVAGVVGFCATAGSGWRLVGSGCGRLALMVGLIVALAAAQLAPFLELLLVHSQRAGEFQRLDWEIPWSGWANLIVPLFKTVHSPGGIAFLPGQFWTNSYYAGIGTVFLAICALLRPRDRRVFLLFAIALLGLWLALGEKGGLLPWVEQALLPFRLIRFQVKYIVLTGFALPLLAAYGVRWWFAGSTSRAQIVRASCILGGMLALAIAGLLVFAADAPAPDENWPATFHNGWSRAVLLGGMVACLILLRNAGGLASRRALIVGLVLLVGIDQRTHEPSQNPTAEPRIMAPILDSAGAMKPLPALGESRAMTTSEAGTRVYFGEVSDTQNYFFLTRLTLLGNYNLLERIPSTYGLFSLFDRESDYLMFHIRSAVGTDLVRNPLLDLVGVSQVSKPGSDFEWLHRDSALPMLSFARDARYFSDEETLNALKEPAYDPRQVIFLPESLSGKLETDSGAQGKVLEFVVSPHCIEATVEVDRPTVLRVAQSSYPCWRAFLDGQRQALLKADFAFQAVEIPKGQHTLILRYFDAYFACGLAIGWLFLAVCARILLRGLGLWGGTESRAGEQEESSPSGVTRDPPAG